MVNDQDSGMNACNKKSLKDFVKDFKDVMHTKEFKEDFQLRWITMKTANFFIS